MNRTPGQVSIAIALSCALAVPVLSQQSTEGNGAQPNGTQPSGASHGPGTYGYGGKWGAAMGYDMGRGMMGGCRHDYRMGRGVMHGYGMGPGMMWGSGMEFYGDHALGLSQRQREEIEKIRRATADKNWELLGKLRDARENLYDLYGAAELDSAAVTRAYKRASELREEMFENHLDAQERIAKMLTAQQRKTWRFMHRGMGFGMMEGYEP